MSRWKNNGGWNKSHGTVEKTPRIDSYEAGEIDGCGVLFGYADGGIPLTLDCCHDIKYAPDGEQETLEVWGKWCQTLMLTRKKNGLGGSQVFFLCPSCGGRVRYLYQVGAAFLCRKCAGLNYKSQQATRSNSMYYYDKGISLAEKRLSTWIRPDGFSFCGWIPERPRYMHQTTYTKYLRRFAKYQDRHSARQIEDMARILGMWRGL